MTDYRVNPGSAPGDANRTIRPNDSVNNGARVTVRDAGSGGMLVAVLALVLVAIIVWAMWDRSDVPTVIDDAPAATTIAPSSDATTTAPTTTTDTTIDTTTTAPATTAPADAAPVTNDTTGTAPATDSTVAPGTTEPTTTAPATSGTATQP